MKSRITRIYDKNKTHSRKKYILIIAAILLLQVAVYFGIFSKAERVIPIKYINYYTLEAFDSSIDVQTDINGDYVVLPEIINSREIITYYIEEVAEDSTNTTQYQPNNTYYVGDAQELTIKVEYGEYITTENNKSTNEAENVETETTTENNTEIIKESDTEIIKESDTENTETEEITITDTEDTNTLGEEKTVIRDTVYLGNIRPRGRRRN